VIRALSFMRVVMSSSPSELKIFYFPHHLSLFQDDYRGIAKWFGAHYNQEVRFSSVVKDSLHRFANFTMVGGCAVVFW